VVRPVLRRGEKGHERRDRGQGAAQRGALGALQGDSSTQERHAGEDDRKREEPGDARDEAQPVGPAAEEEPERDDGRRVPPQARQALEADPGAEDGEDGEGREAERGDERVASVGQG
jgi:hypothetical protein